MVQFFFQEGLSFLPSNLPNVRDSNDVEVQFLVVVFERREMRLPEAVGESDDTEVNTIV